MIYLCCFVAGYLIRCILHAYHELLEVEKRILEKEAKRRKTFEYRKRDERFVIQDGVNKIFAEDLERYTGTPN